MLVFFENVNKNRISFSKIFAGIFNICTNGSHCHQSAHPDARKSIEFPHSGIGILGHHTAFAYFPSAVNLHQNVRGDSQHFAASADFLGQAEGIHTLNEGHPSHHLLHLVGLQMTDEMLFHPPLQGGIFFHQF